MTERIHVHLPKDLHDRFEAWRAKQHRVAGHVPSFANAARTLIHKGLVAEGYDAAPKLAKRPVAFRCKDYADGWIVFQDEAEANDYQERTGCEMQGLYVRAQSDHDPSNDGRAT